MAPTSEPTWKKNNFLNLHIPLPAFIMIAIVAILLYCIILSCGCAALRRRRTGGKSEKKLVGHGQEIAVMTAFLRDDRTWEGSGGVTAPDRAKTRVRDGIKGVVSQIKGVGRR